MCKDNKNMRNTLYLCSKIVTSTLYFSKMLSKNKQKLIRLLGQKKHRDEQGLFLAEGPKVVGDLLGHFRCHLLCGTAEWLAQHPEIRQGGRDGMVEEIIEVSQHELEQASLLKTPRDVLAVFRRKPETVGTQATCTSPEELGLALALDGVQDPGNLGTILRIADWFGIGHVFCSLDTADAFSPKTIMATMGAIARVEVHYVDLPAFLQGLPKDCPVYGTFLDGTDIYAQTLSQTGIIVMGNEGNGISPAVAQLINRRLFIPSYPADRETSESLNVAIATAITCAEFRRR